MVQGLVENDIAFEETGEERKSEWLAWI